MAKIKYVDVDIYKTGVTIFVGTHSEFIKYLKDMASKYDYYKEIVPLAEDRDNTSVASFYWDAESRTLIVEVTSLKFNYNTLGEVVHELDHAAFYILDECGVYYGTENGTKEVHTYLLELLVRGTFNKEGYEVVGK